MSRLGCQSNSYGFVKVIFGAGEFYEKPDGLIYAVQKNANAVANDIEE